MATASKDDLNQKKLKNLIQRRHPEYEENSDHWDFCEDTYEGGRDWFEKNVFRYVKEGNLDYKERVKRCYRFNHTKEVVDLVDRYIFKMVVTRSDDAPDALKRFWECSTLQRQNIDALARQNSKYSSIYGRAYLVVDSTNTGSEVVSKADEKNSDMRVYAYLVSPNDAVDMSFDDEGNLNWILIKEEIRDDFDPLESSGEMIERYRLWDKEDWTLFTVEGSGNKLRVQQDGPHPHGLGLVPVIPINHTMNSDDMYCAPSLIDDVAYLDRALANYLSSLDQIIQDQTFSQLAMPAQNILPGEDAYNKLVEMGTKRIFIYDGESNTQPFYLSPDVKQAQLILQVVNKIIGEIYHTVGLAGERTKDDNGAGIDNSSGVAKAYDFERTNALLSAKASSLEYVENRLCEIVLRWNGISGDGKLPVYVSYPKTFDVRGLYDEFEIAARLSLLEAPDALRQEQMKHVIDKLFPQLKSDLKDKIMSELKQWPPKEVIEDTPQNGGSSYKGQIKSQASNKLANKLVS